MERPNLTAVFVVAAVVGFVGPRLSSPQDRASQTPFVYTPPAGFTVEPNVEGALQTWVYRAEGAKYTPNVTLSHTEKKGAIEETDLRVLVQGMPAVFRETGAQWSEVRHETRVRPDGSHVGLIEGETVRGELRSRVMQLVFPDDKGTSIVTASFPIADAPRWEPEFEASIASATGVATRVGSPPPWMYLAWGAAGAVLAYLVTALGARAKKPVRDAAASGTP
jgi:hypothetical protein